MRYDKKILGIGDLLGGMRMYRDIQLIAFLKNAPGELARLCELLRARDVNILAMSIQDAEDYLRGLLKAREITGRRIATAASYGSIIRDSEEYSVIRFIVERHQTEEAIRILREAGYPMETTPVLVIVLDNQPGALGNLAKTFADAGINIDYVYGSVLSGMEKSLFIVHVKEEELRRAGELFPLE